MKIILSAYFPQSIKLLKKIKLLFFHNLSKYDLWIKENEKNNKKNAEMDIFEFKPLISIIMPVWNTDEHLLDLAIKSVINQSYENWQLCIADGNSSNKNLKKIIQLYSSRDNRIKSLFLDDNKGISGNTNKALNLADGIFVCFLDHDDELSSNCLYEVVKKINENNEYDIIYSDNDKIDKYGERSDPFFKFDFSLPALLSTNYPFHLFVCRKSLIDSVGGLRSEFDGAQDYDLILRVVERTTPEKIAHIDKVLYHWRIIPESSAHSTSAKPYAYNAGKLALQGYLNRNNIPGSVFELEPGSYLVKKEMLSNPLVIILVVANKHRNSKFIQKFNLILKESTFHNTKLFIPEIYQKEIVFSDFQTFDKNPIEQLREISKFEKYDYLIIVNDNCNFDDNFKLNPDWIQSLIEHYYYFNVGIVGTGSLVFSNIICNVERPCGPIFCVNKEIMDIFLDQKNIIHDYDELQINLSDLSEEMCYTNLYTPFSIGNIPQYNSISQYYLGLRCRKFFTNNMEYYLPLNLRP
ncbi:glycosyltransferase family 2 protein [Methanolacinia paynteri]|uniref:glycosyltransferase family 2 protein n=1 Tax=Methanolacinia paynteri TaxID=230356 RepID=UPI000694FAB8|nr:glycosyltransferase [Methanolacinia paynteri]